MKNSQKNKKRVSSKFQNYTNANEKVWNKNVKTFHRKISDTRFFKKYK